jgi:hypothetical protein
MVKTIIGSPSDSIPTNLIETMKKPTKTKPDNNKEEKINKAYLRLLQAILQSPA